MHPAKLHAAVQEHAEYKAWQPSLELYQDLYTGGAQLRSKASHYLYRRHREPMDVYQERVSRAYYENYLGSIVDWYAASLFRREPVLAVESAANRTASYYYKFFENCDRNHTSITDFLRKRFIESLVFGRAYCGLEFPKVGGEFQSRWEEERAGADQAYLTEIHPLDVINWERDEFGRLTFLTIKLGEEKDVASGQEGKVKKFLVYDQTDYTILRTDKDGNLHILETGPHALAGIQTVPVFQLAPSEGLWLTNKAAHLQLEHFNKANSLAWSLGMALYSTPVIYSKRDFHQALSESYYIQLDPEDKFGFAEPTGNVYRIALENLERLQEEIYRTCYLLGQARSWMSGGMRASGQSKQQDFQITKEVLRSYGDGVKDFLKRLLTSLSQARQDQVRITVSGLDEFEAADFAQEITEVSQLFALGLESKTFRQQVLKKLAMKFLGDVNEATKEQIAREIDHSLGEQK